MNKRLSKSVLITLTVFLVSFYMGATASADGLSMYDILNDTTSYTNDNSTGDEIYSFISSQEKNSMTIELTATSTMVSVASAMYGEDTTTINDNVTPTVDNPNADDSKFANMAIAVVDKYVNVRKTTATNAEVVGKLYNGSFATVVSENGEWLQIKSGNVMGYVKSEYLVRGDEVKQIYKKYIQYMATSKVDSLNVRSSKSTSASIVTKLKKGSKCTVIDQTDSKWVQVAISDKKGYVAKEYVEIKLDYKTGISIKEEAELQKAAAQNKLSDAASSLTTTYGSKTTINSADMRLLVCLVFCESGSEPYEGKLAVANVVLNRYHSSRFPNTIKGVIYQSGQFSPTWNGSLNKKLATYDAGGFKAANHLQSIQAVKDALDGKNNIGSRLYFNGYNYEKNRGHKNAVRINNHLFW